MSLSTRFLNLSMKEQICLAIIVLTLFCILVILIVCCSLMYEILNKDYEQKKAYFYNKYKDYIESTFYFQSFYIMQYEEIMHRMQKQISLIQQSVSNIYYGLMPLQDYSNYIINMTETHNYTELKETNNIENPYFYMISYNNARQEFIKNFSLKNYQTFSNSIISHDIYYYFRMPGYGVSICDDPLFYNKYYLTLFTFNESKISNEMKYLNETILENILGNTISEATSKAKEYLKYVNNNLDIFSKMFKKFYNELTSFDKDIFSNETISQYYAEILVGYISNIDYENNNVSIVSSDETRNYFITRMNIINDILFFLNKNLTYSLDIDFIPLNNGNNKIISPELCSLFKIKQKILAGNEFNYSDIYSNINKGGSDPSSCFIDDKLIESQEEIKDIFDILFENFTELNNIIYQGILNIIPNNEKFPFYFMKYSFPNYNTLKEFQSEYLFSKQINYYSFASFRTAQNYVDHVYQVSINIFYFIVMVIIYSWLACLFINLMIFFKVIKEWTEPITKLQEAVESNSIKDDNIFNYKYDDIINELFLTCKELLSGQIDNNNENGLKNFNILGKDKESKIDKNIYKKNLIINNEIMEELISKQQSMMDFSNNVKVNEPNSLSSGTTSKKKKYKKYQQIDENLSTHIDSSKKTEKERKERENILKNERNKENEPYIKLFKISEYLNYYRSKLESNNIIYNEGIDESKMSKIISKNEKSINSSISNNLRNDDTNEGYNINMLDEKNITYLWYMEAKKKFKNFNYNISNDCKELFTEFDDSYKTISRSEMKKSIHMRKKERNTEV